jgi:hypothetical protein
METTPRQEEFLHRVLAEEMENRERSRLELPFIPTWGCR